MDRTESSNKGGKYQGSGYVYTVHEQIHTGKGAKKKKK